MSLGAACLVVLPQGVPATPRIQHWINQDAVPVYFVNLPELPMVDIQLRFTRSGHAYDGEKYGLAAMTGRMIKQGAKDMDADQIAETFESLGAAMGTGADHDSITLKLRSLTEEKYLAPALQTCIDVLSSPSFPQAQFERVRKSMLTSIENKYQHAAVIAAEKFREAVYGDHPYAHPASGTIDTINAMTLEDVRGFYTKHYVTSNLIITMVGAISRAQASAIADKITASIAKGSPGEPLPPVPKLKAPMTIRVDFPSEQAHVIVGQPFINVHDPDRYALRLGNSILGGGGFGSRLFEEIRVKRGFAYSVGSGITSKVAAGFFRVSFQTRADQVDAALETAREVLHDFVASGPTEEEVAMELDRIRGSNVFRTDNNKKILSAVSQIGFHNRPLDYLDTYTANFEAETRGSIGAAFQKHLQPNTMVTVIVGRGTEQPTRE